jgi:hypothetical protein
MTWLLAVLAAALTFWAMRVLGWRRGWAFLASLAVLIVLGRANRGDHH